MTGFPVGRYHSLMNFQDAIAEAIQLRVPSRLIREEIDDGPLHGYVLGATSDLLLLAVVGDDIRLNGFTVLRIPDLTDMKVPERSAGFVAKALELRGENPTVPEVDLSSIVTVIRSASEGFPLITVHCEVEDPNACYIGQVFDLDDDRLLLTSIDTNAEWDMDEPEEFDIEEITRIDFGGQYEDALYLVGGDPPVSRS